MTKKILRMPNLIKKIGLSKPTIYRLIKNGDFPPHTRLTQRSVGWVEEDIDIWLDGRVAER
jgi:prophage regulatory protein